MSSRSAPTVQVRDQRVLTPARMLQKQHPYRFQLQRSRQMAKRKVLYVTYDHPAVHPGGAQQHALELYEAMRASDEFEPMLLAYYQSGTRNTLTARGAAPFGRVTVDDPNQYFLFARRSIADALHFTSSNKD